MHTTAGHQHCLLITLAIFALQIADALHMPGQAFNIRTQNKVNTPAARTYQQRSNLAAYGSMLATLSNNTSPGTNSTCPPCPPCTTFNCNLKADPCVNFGTCDASSGKCQCPVGFGGDNCNQYTCQSPINEATRSVQPLNQECQCNEGWQGINCNSCQTDQACHDLMVAAGQDPTEADPPTCYSGFHVVKKNFFTCDIENPFFVGALAPRTPVATMSCEADSASCQFQFGIKEVSGSTRVNPVFYCGFSSCAFSYGSVVINGQPQNSSSYQCAEAFCACNGDAEFCSSNPPPDQLSLAELVAQVSGPASFKCVNGTQPNCDFQTEVLNDYGGVPLNCRATECMAASAVPGTSFTGPKILPVWMIVVPSVTGAALLGVLLWFILRKKLAKPSIVLYESETDLVHDACQATLTFENIGYHSKAAPLPILKGINGVIEPGKVCAILGGSGAGKTTFLDILANKDKVGTIEGAIRINGRELQRNEMKRICGFVDQEDTLMPTLTVWETLLLSAQLRCPRTMTDKQKQQRVVQIMNELRIDHLKDVKIGQSGMTGKSMLERVTFGRYKSSARRGLSGGEKRRVSIAVELVTSPAILFLDEPTSGLDAYNASKVIQCLKNLAGDFGRTVIMTIHQPRSNIYAMFDYVVLLSRGTCLYSGPRDQIAPHFKLRGWECPYGTNIADWLIDLTMMDEITAPRREDGTVNSLDSLRPYRRESLDNADSLMTKGGSPERDLVTKHIRQDSTLESHPIEPIASPYESEQNISLPYDVREYVTNTSDPTLCRIAGHFRSSSIFELIKEKIRVQHAAPDQDLSRWLEAPRAHWGTQFNILSRRTAMNLYRDPSLLYGHIITSILLGTICGALYWKVTNDIAGFQNRIGLFFFLLAFYGISSLSSLETFNAERNLLVRERSNGFYKASAYYVSKLLFDLIPLRFLPPVLCGSILYYMVGLNLRNGAFGNFLLILIGFNMMSAQLWLLVGVVYGARRSLASLSGTLLLMYSMVFCGVLLNQDKIPPSIAWLGKLSYFFYTMEAMLNNEILSLAITDQKMGIVVSVPGSEVLKTFGFRTGMYSIDVGILYSIWAACAITTWLAVLFLVRERR